LSILKIKKLEAALVPGRSIIKDSSLVPGEVYRLKINVFSSDSGLITQPYYNNIIIDSPNNSLQVTKLKGIEKLGIDPGRIVYQL
jgi:hypothetical protein